MFLHTFPSFIQIYVELSVKNENAENLSWYTL